MQTVNNNVVDTEEEDRVAFKEISAYLTLLEGGKPQDKLECETLLQNETIFSSDNECYYFKSCSGCTTQTRMVS